MVFTSRVQNGDENPADIFYSNVGELNLNTNMISSKGGLRENQAKALSMKPNLLPELIINADACKKPQAPPTA